MKCEKCGGVLSTYLDEYNIIHRDCPYCGWELDNIDISTVKEIDCFGFENMSKMWEEIQ